MSARIQPWFGTTNDIVLLTAAGTGGLEAAVVNTLSPGDPVLAVTIGAFGDRFAKVAAVYGADVTTTRGRVGPGRRAGCPSRGARAGASRRRYRAVLLTHNETSTGRHEPDR